jgi:nitrite reductase (NADH) large subunit
LNKPFPSYLEIPAKLPANFWWAARVLTFAVMLAVMWLLVVSPTDGFSLFWKVLIPSLPLLFAVAPGIWRQVCPMAFVNQLPRTFGFSKDLTLPVRFKNLAYSISVLAFFFLVSLRHVYFNQNPAALSLLVFGALGLAFLGGVIFKGRSGWCGTFCPLAPIQKAYGHAPVFTIRNGYCPTCVGCQKNCYDFNPRAAFLSDIADKDQWYAGHKKFFVAGLPGFAIGFFTAQDLAQTDLLAYYVHLGSWIVVTLGIYMAARIFVSVSNFRAASISAMSALVIFYWYTGAGIVVTLAGFAGMQAPEWASKLPFVVALATSLRVLYLGVKAEADFVALNNGGAEPRVGVKIDIIRRAAGGADDLISERKSGRSFAAEPGRTLLDGIESAGLTMDFGCRMGMCGADPIAIVDGMENLCPPSDDELATLRRLGLEGRARMACVCKAAKGGVTIDLGMNPNDLPEPPPPENQRDLGQESGVQKVVIIGNGTTGMAAADEVRRHSASCKIDVLARENHHFYNRMAIGRLLYGRTGLDDLYLMQPDWYQKKSIDVWLNTWAVAIDRERKQVTLGTGESLPYDKLVLAMGSSAMVPPAEGMHLPGCFVLREAADAQAIRGWRQHRASQKATVLGGGVLGIEAADALRRLNVKTTIIQRADRLMNKELDEKGSAILRQYLERLGIEVITGASVAKVLGQNHVQQLELSNGNVMDADIYIACAGVKANSEVAAAAGIEVNKGVVVDASMRTSDPDIVAAGDVAELPGAISGLWAVGTAQAAVAAATLFGKEASYSAPSTLVSLKMDGIDVKGFGRLTGGEGIEEICDPDEPENEHRRLFISDGRIVGAVFVGPPGTGQDVGAAIQKKADLSGILDRLRNKDWAALGTV